MQQPCNTKFLSFLKLLSFFISFPSTNCGKISYKFIALQCNHMHLNSIWNNLSWKKTINSNCLMK